jgi:hypothetical protein
MQICPNPPIADLKKQFRNPPVTKNYDLERVLLTYFQTLKFAIATV